MNRGFIGYSGFNSRMRNYITDSYRDNGYEISPIWIVQSYKVV